MGVVYTCDHFENIKTAVLKCVDVLKNGGLAVFPTETVYGIGADALNENAVKKIFDAKNRPMDNPLIVHVACKEDILKVAREIPSTIAPLNPLDDESVPSVRCHTPA